MIINTKPLTEQSELERFCALARQSRFVTVDTEFFRERSYYAKLCLVQIACEQEAVAIDALAPNLDLAPFLALLADEAVIKVFHSARQDLEIFYLLDHRFPNPLFDTQIAATACGFGSQIGYDNLVERITGEKIDKSSRNSDWSKRPLSQKQINYALGDVTHLRAVFEHLEFQLEKKGRRQWIKKDIAALQDPQLYKPDIDQLWRKLKPRQNDQRLFARLRALTALREEQAQRRDLNRQRVLSDASLMEIAQKNPSNQEELKQVRNFERSRLSVEAILSALEQAQSLSLSECPPPKARSMLENKGTVPVEKILQALLQIQGEKLGVAPTMIASSQDINALATGQHEGLGLLHDWRREIFGQLALDFLEGRLQIAMKNGQLTILEA